MKKVIIYTGDLCIHCDWAKDLLNRKNIQFIEYNVQKDVSKREEMLKKSNGARTVPQFELNLMLKKSNGARTVPQIFIGDYHVGGNVELQKLEKEGKLNSLIGI